MLISKIPGSIWTLIALGILISDQLTKVLARWLLPLCDQPGCDTIELFGPLGLVRVSNAGSVFGFAQGFDIWIVIAAAGVVVGPLLSYRSGDHTLLAGAALLAGGGLGNLVDRVFGGAVTDFIDIGVPIVFNLADVALALGCLVMTIALLRHPTRTPQGCRSS